MTRRRRTDGRDFGFFWGFECPRCDGDTEIFTDDATGTVGWVCPTDDCQAIGFGFRSRRAARVGLREYRERAAEWSKGGPYY